MTYASALITASVAAAAFVAGWLARRLRDRRLLGRARSEAEDVLAAARGEADTVRRAAEIEGKEELLRARQQGEAEAERLRGELARRQAVLDEREAGLDSKSTRLDQKEGRLESREQQLRESQAVADEARREAERLQAEQVRRLEEVAGLSADEARRRVSASIEAEARAQAARQIKRIHDETERTARRQAQKILSTAVQRYAADHVAEESVSVIDLPSDEMKGRIIGREGRNIRCFEEAAGVDVIIDDTPEAVVLSSFDPLRREVASRAMQALIKDGRIHPGRIEEVVDRCRREVADRVRELGEEACLEVGVADLHEELVPYIGRLAYRSSYGQNLLGHAKEVAVIGGIIAAELGLDAKLARRCGFLHDIGKAADHEVEGPHAVIGGRLCRKYGESDVVINAVEGHHAEVEPQTPYTYIAAAADAVSASRPGARRESLEGYITRLEDLERIAGGFDGVQKCYAIQAGREVRILVDHALVDDDAAALLAEEVSRRVEEELEYPGEIRIMVIRETRASAVAR